MTGADGTYDYKAMAAGIVLAGGEGMGNLLPVVEKELLHYRMGQIILDVESPTEILADKLLSYACASHLRRRDLWDMCWLASRGDVDSRRAMELAELKSSDYGEEGLWADRADRVAGVADVIGSDAFADEMRRFLPAGLMTSTVESPRWSAWAIEQIGTLYGTPGTPSSADAVPGFPIFGASNDSSPTR